jgi:hypothetical protein
VKAAHIVPFFLDMDKLSEILFDTQSDSPEKGGNTLLMSNRIESWFDNSSRKLPRPSDPNWIAWN